MPQGRVSADARYLQRHIDDMGPGGWKDEFCQANAAAFAGGVDDDFRRTDSALAS